MGEKYALPSIDKLVCMKKKVIIVGTGMGGLSTGLRLASEGYQVVFLEKNKKPGGRLNRIQKEGFTFDVGPSFFSMPYEFESLMADCQLSMPFEFEALEPLYTVNFKGSDRTFLIYKDLDKLSAQFEGLELNFKQKFSSYLKSCEIVYNDTVNVVIKQNFNNIADYLKALLTVNPRHLPLLFRSFWNQVDHCFESKEAKQIVSLIAFFLGRTPFDTNAVYTLLSHIEFSYTGYYNVKGGMYTMVETMVDILEQKQAVFHYETEIIGYKSEDDRLIQLIDQHHEAWDADLFVINADAALFRGEVFKRKAFSTEKLNRMQWTMGYLTIYLGIDRKLPMVEHHNYYLGSNFEGYAKTVLKNPETLENPYYYVNVLSKNNPDCAPEGCEALFFVCPVPNLLHKADWSDKQKFVESILRDFSNTIQVNVLEHQVFRMEYTPEDWKKQFNLFAGAGLGLSHNMMQIGAFRPRNADEKFKNTFYVGASTIPGAGLPMAVIGSKLVTERILNQEK